MAEYTSLTKFKIWPKLGSDYTSQVLKARLSAEQALRVRIAQRNEWARVGLVLLATMALAIVAFMTDSHGRGNISGVLLLLAFLLEAAGVYWALSRNVTDIIALTLVSAIEKMDRHSILEVDIARNINAKIQRVAASIERIPRYFGTKHPQMIDLATKKAQGMRDLETWVTAPMHDTSAQLQARLGDDLVTVLEHRWQDLPDSTPLPRALTWKGRFSLVVGALVLIGGGAYFLSAQRDWQPWSQLIAYLLFAIAFGLLNKSGWIPGTYEQSLNLAKNLKPADAPKD